MKKKSSLHLISAALVGHILEFFDFTMFMVFAVTIGESFFPTESKFAQVLLSLAVFAVGFLMRPIGGLYFGHIGDRYGRKQALTFSVMAMAAFTFGIALLPDYNSIGILAPVILVLLRLGQGFCVGGEGTGAAVFLLEHLDKLKPGFVGGIVNAGLISGILLAMLTGIILKTTFGENNDAWRYAFLIGGCVGVVGVYIRMTITETPVFSMMQKKQELSKLPIKEVLNGNKNNIIFAILYSGLFGVSGYLVVGFLNLFLTTILEYDPVLSLYFAAYGALTMVFMLPMFGMISDEIGYVKTMKVTCILVLLTSVPIFQLLSSNEISNVFAGVFCLSALSAAIHAPMYPLMMKMFSPSQRYSGIAFCMNIGIAIFGGTCSIICLWLIQQTNSLFAPAYYWSALSATTLFALMMRTRRSQGKENGAVQH